MTDPVFIALHVPKCAGTTVETHLGHHLGRGFWSPPKRTRQAPLSLFTRKYDARLPAPTEEIRAVSGHFIGRSVLDLLGRPAHLSILLRDPEALLLSWYNFRMMRYAAKGQATYPFALHLRAMPPDPVAHFLLERWLELPWWRLAALSAERKVALLDKMLGDFDFVGDIADADRLIAEISGRLGIPTIAEASNTSEDWQALTGWKPLRRTDLQPATVAELARRTRLDSYLWRRWACGDSTARPPAAPAGFLASELRRPIAELRRRLIRGA